MNAPQWLAAPASGTEIPDFEALAADPEIAPLLHFDPVVRKVKRPDGWTPELQRELIARIASAGTLQAAVWQMGKHATGAEALYKVPAAQSFRTSWDAAIIIGRRRNGLDSAPPYAGPVPGIQRRGSSRTAEPQPEPEMEMGEEQKWDLIQSIGGKFMRKVAAEREARLSGEIVAADFYLRQITFLEVMFDLTASRLGWSPNDALAELRRGEHGLVDIATTPLRRMARRVAAGVVGRRGRARAPVAPGHALPAAAPDGGGRVQHLHRPVRLRSADHARAGVHA